MKKEKVGLLIFWIAAIWILLWGIIGSLFLTPVYRNLTMEEVNQTMWASNGIWFIIWGVFGVALGAIIALIGVLLNSGAKISTALKYGIGIFLVLIISMMVGMGGHIPILFGIGGTIMLLCFIGILKMWAKERMAIKNESYIALDFKLVSYVFFLITAWFTCGMAGFPYLKAMEGVTQGSPIHLMIFFVLGWIFLFLSHYKSQKS
jgi:hypothetical protein